MGKMGAREADQERAERAVREFLEALGLDLKAAGMEKTPERVAKMYALLFSGVGQATKPLWGEVFKAECQGLVAVRHIPFYSMCEHHLLPFFGRVHVAYIPNHKVVGLSKIPRMVNIFARRLQIQEQLTEQIAEAVQEVIKPKGVGVVIEARHMCVEMRGVGKINSTTTTSALRGCFLNSSETRREFFSLINSHKEVRF